MCLNTNGKPLTDTDRQAVEDFRKHLKQLAAHNPEQHAAQAAIPSIRQCHCGQPVTAFRYTTDRNGQEDMTNHPCGHTSRVPDMSTPSLTACPNCQSVAVVRTPDGIRHCMECAHAW